MLIEGIQRIVQNLRRQNLPSSVIQNHIKEYLQLYVLDFIFNSTLGKQFIFTGGTCLRHCYGLNRLSEDIDFDLTENIDIEAFAASIHDHFSKSLQYRRLEVTVSGKNKKVYLKFPILHSLGLADASASDKLYVKIETSPQKVKNFKTELTPINKEQLNFLARHYDLPSMMAGKIGAIFNRVYFKGKENEITFKGRDVYDLVWYLGRGIRPNMKMIKDVLKIDSEKILFEKIFEKVKNYRPEYLLKDLENLFDNHVFIKNWCENYLTILSGHIETLK